MSIPEDYGQLAGERELIKKMKYLERQLTGLEELLGPFCQAGELYSKLSLEEQVQYDIFLSYSLTSLYWMYTRTTGEDPNQQPVKDEVHRVQEYMKMYHTIKDRKKAPTLDSAAAKRFIRSGLFDLKSLKQGKRKVFEDGEAMESGSEEPPPAPSLGGDLDST